MIEANMPLRGQGTQSKPDRIVVHAMAEFLDLDPTDQYATYFLGLHGLSAHVLITPTGTAIRCLQDTEMGAHAKGFNRNSLGIEYLVPGVHTYATFTEAIDPEVSDAAFGWLTEAAYYAGRDVIHQWMEKWALDSTRVQRHSILSPGRKLDPGDGFPWARLLDELG